MYYLHEKIGYFLSSSSSPDTHQVDICLSDKSHRPFSYGMRLLAALREIITPATPGTDKVRTGRSTVTKDILFINII